MDGEDTGPRRPCRGSQVPVTAVKAALTRDTFSRNRPSVRCHTMIRQRLRNIRSFKERETRRVFALLLAGKMTAIVLLLGGIKAFMMLLDTPVGAAVSSSTHHPNDFVSPVNTIWVLVTAFLVFF